MVNEVYRVLEPGGKFVFTVNTNKINEFLFWPEILRKWGFDHLAKKYINLYYNSYNYILDF